MWNVALEDRLSPMTSDYILSKFLNLELVVSQELRYPSFVLAICSA